MNASSLQSFIARNAAVITGLDAQAGSRKDRAAFQKQNGDMSLYYHEIKLLGGVRKALRKAHKIQNDLIRELKSEYTRASTVAFLIASGHGASILPAQTLPELETLADAVWLSRAAVAE